MTTNESPKYIVRNAFEDQYPRGTDLQTAARDSVIRYARHHGLTFRWLHDQYGEKWVPDREAGVYRPTGVYGWRSEALVTGVTA